MNRQTVVVLTFGVKPSAVERLVFGPFWPVPFNRKV